MATLTEYRYSIDKQTKELFVKSFKKALNKVDKNKFGFIGIVGSLMKEKSHDIDVVIFPNFKAKIGEAIIEYAKLYDEIEKELKKHNERYYIAACQKFAMQELTIHLSAIEEGYPGMIPVHSMFFTNYRDFQKFSPAGFVKDVENNSIVFHGNLKDMKKLPAIPQNKLEPYFFVLDFEMNSRIKTFPRHLIRTSAESLFDYLNKKYNINIKEKIPHNIKEIKSNFVALMHQLDEKTYRN